MAVRSLKLCLTFVIFTALTFKFGFARYYSPLNSFPKPRNHAKVARQLVHDTDWSSVGSLSTDEKINGYPMVNIISVADSAKGAASTGNIYFLLTDMDFTGQDWQKDNKLTFLFSQEQGGGCSKKNIDPMEPTCARAVISGKVVKMNDSSIEYQAAWEAFLSRHPAAKKWIEAHNFYLCKLDIKHIYVFDFYGGAKDISVEDYYKSNPEISMLSQNGKLENF